MSKLVELTPREAWNEVTVAGRARLRVIPGGGETHSPRRNAARELTDAELVVAAQGGACWAEDALARRHLDGIMTMVDRLLGGSAEVDDVVQETFLHAFQGLSRLSAPAAFKGWLYRIAINRVRRAIRRRRLLRALGLDTSEHGVFLDELAHDQVRSEVRSELAALDQVLRQLPADRRIAWTLRHIQGHSIKDVARLTSCSESTTKRRIAAAHKKVEAAVDVEVLRHG